jgi:hypothetical protein
MDQKQLTQKSKAEHPQTKTKTKNKQKQQKQKTKKTAKRKPNNPHGIHLTKKHLSPKIKKRYIIFYCCFIISQNEIKFDLQLHNNE